MAKQYSELEVMEIHINNMNGKGVYRGTLAPETITKLTTYINKEKAKAELAIRQKILDLDNPYGTTEGDTAESLKMAFHAFEVGRGMAIGVLATPLAQLTKEGKDGNSAS